MCVCVCVCVCERESECVCVVRFLIFNTTGLRRHKTNFKCPVQGLTRQWGVGGGEVGSLGLSVLVRSGQVRSVFNSNIQSKLL